MANAYLKMWLSLTILVVPPAANSYGMQPDGERGHAFANTHCSRCHAVGDAGPSPLATAPKLRKLSERYPLEDLAEACAEGVLTGHSAMPEWVLEPDEIDDLLAYMQTLQGRLSN